MSAAVNRQVCEADTSYCKFGCQTISSLLKGFEKNIIGVIQNRDVECVHKTRVASRKLRAAMPIFQPCFPNKKFKGWTKQIKNVTKLLGNARDLDVQIAFVEKYLKNLGTPEKEPLNRLLADRKNERDGIQPLVARGLEKLKASGVLEDMRAFCENSLNRNATANFDVDQVLEKAQWHISFRLDDFLSLEKYVHSEDANEKHHEMRIYAKRLRYTMEFFAELYKNKLDSQIETVKNYQDILGEKHDLEVWIEYIPKFIAKTNANGNEAKVNDSEQALENFLGYIKDQRKEHYQRFVNLWQENQSQNFFEQLRETTKAGPKMSERKMNQIFANPDIKIALLADVHANLAALQAVVQDAEERCVDAFLNAGDSVGFGPHPNGVIEFLCEKDIVSILGNYDAEVIEGKTDAKGDKKVSFKFTKKELAKSCQSYLYSLPRELRLEVAGKKLLVTHGSPESIDEHIRQQTPDDRLKSLADKAEADVVVVGHSHEQFIRGVDDVYFVNPGSVGRPGDGNPQAAYAVLTFNPFKVEMIRLDYDVQATADDLRRRGLPESLAQMLLRGVALDVINREDKEKENSAENCGLLVAASDEFTKRYGQDTEHYRQVTKLALQLFDGLVRLHKLGNRERCWLECAAIMHDVGLVKGSGRHHKESAEMILNDTKLPFTTKERRAVASIARYHRKALPKQKHYNLKALDPQTVRTIKVLSSLLRVADGLDYTHQSNVKKVELIVKAKKVTAECTCDEESVLEQQAFNKKKDLFEKVFSKNLVLAWKKQ